MGASTAKFLIVGSVVRLATAKGVHAAEARVAALPGCKTWPSPVQACTISLAQLGWTTSNS
jgi:hypothetical protein